MSSAEEARLVEILLTHNEAVACEDLSCALGIPRTAVQALAVTLQDRGYAIFDPATDSVEATPTADSYRS